MIVYNLLRPIYRVLLSFFAVCVVFCLLLTTPQHALANTVRISDPVGVLNASQVTNEGAKLTYALDIYTTNSYSGTASDFVQRTISAHLTSKSLIVIAIDTTHRYLAIVGGTSVPVSNSQYTSAGTAFKNNFSNNNYTNATIAAIQSIEQALHIGTTSSSSSSSSSGGLILIILLVVVGLVIISAIFRFIKRLLFGGPPPTPRNPEPPRYGDGRDNLGGGAVGNF